MILNAIFIPRYGFIAAGYTTAVGYFILVIAHYIFMCKIQPEKIYDSKVLAIITSIVVILTFAIIFLYNYIMIRYVLIFLVFIISLLNIKKIIKYLKKKKELIDG